MILGVLSFVVGGVTTAYFKDGVDHELATFSTAKVEIEVKQGKNISSSSTEFEENRNVEWEIKNKGTESIRLKTTILESGTDRNEEIILTSSDGWTQGDDGDYYYAEVVEPDAAVIFPLGIQFDTWNTVDDYGINIEAEAIQASNDAIDYEWIDHSYRR